MNNGSGPKRNPNEVGAAWLKQTKNGDDYISIVFNAEATQGLDLSNCFIDMYVNTKKSQPKQPDYRILAKPKQQQAQPQRQQQAPQRAAFPRPKNFAPGGFDDEDPGY